MTKPARALIAQGRVTPRYHPASATATVTALYRDNGRTRICLGEGIPAVDRSPHGRLRRPVMPAGLSISDPALCRPWRRLLLPIHGERMLLRSIMASGRSTCQREIQVGARRQDSQGREQSCDVRQTAPPSALGGGFRVRATMSMSRRARSVRTDQSPRATLPASTRLPPSATATAPA